jgi:predicted cupin superfamily sugar epimerase
MAPRPSPDRPPAHQPFDRHQARAIIERLGLEPLPVEGGLFTQTWRSDDGEQVVGTAIIAAFTDEPDSFSAMHRLTGDEIWHFYLGDPIELLLLHPDGSWSIPTLGVDVLDGHHPQLVVPAGTWMGARLTGGGVFALFGTTMAPGFHSGCYQGGDLDRLVAGWPRAADRIASLTRPGGATSMPEGL